MTSFMKFGRLALLSMAGITLNGISAQRRSEQRSCVVDEWSSWGECEPTKCIPCEYGQGEPGSLAQMSTRQTPDSPRQMNEEDMVNARGIMMNKMMNNKKRSMDDIVSLNAKISPPDLTSQSSVCSGGSAGEFPCLNVDLDWWKSISAIKSGIKSMSDNWGWKSPKSGIEYALVGTNGGTVFMRVNDGGVVGFLPTQTQSSIWQDIKVYDSFALIVSESKRHGLQIFDLLQLDRATDGTTFQASPHYNKFGTAHNIVVNAETARVYVAGSDTCNGGLHAIDIRDPLNPKYLDCAWDTDYVHDAQCVTYRGPDNTYFGKEICFLYSAEEIRIIDVTKIPGKQISKLKYDGVAYAHQGWTNCQMDLLFVDDELDEYDGTVPTAHTYIVDIASLEKPKMLQVFDSGVTAIDHNQYVCGAYVYQANYAAGLRILDASSARNNGFKEIAYFEVYPSSTTVHFNGAWNAFPFFDSGKVLVDSFGGGVGIVSPNLSSQKRTRSVLTSPMNGEVCPLLLEEKSCGSSSPVSSPTRPCRNFCNKNMKPNWKKNCAKNRKKCRGCNECKPNPNKCKLSHKKCKPSIAWKTKCDNYKCAACPECLVN